jgi:Fe2+ transport system protein FeoA
MNLSECESSRTYTIDNIEAKEEGMKEFLLTLGCFPGEDITILSKVSSNLVVNIKNGRYSIDENLASAIQVFERSGLKKIV